MLPIIICDDSTVQCKTIENYVRMFIARENADLKIILATSNPSEVLSCVPYSKDFVGIYLLDVDLKGEINGVLLASKIREKDPLGYIIFLTTHSELSYLTFRYKVEALDYIIKDNYEDIEKRLSQCLKLCIDKHYKHVLKDQILTIERDGRIINIPSKDILYIEASSNPHRVIIHQEKRQLELFYTIKEIENKLSDDFYRCHKAYLVNRKKISLIDKTKGTIYLVNGETCLASKRSLGGLIKCT